MTGKANLIRKIEPRRHGSFFGRSLGELRKTVQDVHPACGASSPATAQMGNRDVRVDQRLEEIGLRFERYVDPIGPDLDL